MTRQKKSRKIGQIGTRKQEKRPSDTTQARRKKAPKGQPSGNRNSLLEDQNTTIENGVKVKKDPRSGSKKKISLVPTNEPQVEKPKPIKQSDLKPTAKLTKGSEQTIEPQVELANIESDEKLIALAERVEAGEILSGKEAKYFNKQMDRLEELLDILGIDDQEDEDEASSESELEGLEQLGSDEWSDLLKDEKS
jgi:uncharacterized protein